MTLLASVSDVWHLVPLTVVVSLVYSATRFETNRQILLHSLRVGIWIFTFLILVMFGLAYFSKDL